MPAITFKGKIETIYNMDDTVAYRRIKVPAIERRHCDMPAFRTHTRFGAYSNSDLFKSMLRHALTAAGIGEYIRLDQLPECVTVDASGFLASVSIHLA